MPCPNQVEVSEQLWIENLPFIYMVHRQEDLTKHHEFLQSQFHCHSNKDTTQMTAGVTLSPGSSLAQVQLGYKTPKLSDLKQPFYCSGFWGTGMQATLSRMAHLCSMWCQLGGSTVDKVLKMAAVTCLAVGAACQLGHLLIISLPQGLSSSRACLSPSFSPSMWPIW